jgi:hypothetical protein
VKDGNPKKRGAGAVAMKNDTLTHIFYQSAGGFVKGKIAKTQTMGIGE